MANWIPDVCLIGTDVDFGVPGPTGLGISTLAMGTADVDFGVPGPIGLGISTLAMGTVADSGVGVADSGWLHASIIQKHISPRALVLRPSWPGEHQLVRCSRRTSQTTFLREPQSEDV